MKTCDTIKYIVRVARSIVNLLLSSFVLTSIAELCSAVVVNRGRGRGRLLTQRHSSAFNPLGELLIQRHSPSPVDGAFC